MCFANVYWLDSIQNSVQKLAVVSYAFMGEFFQPISSRGGFFMFWGKYVPVINVFIRLAWFH